MVWTLLSEPQRGGDAATSHWYIGNESVEEVTMGLLFPCGDR